MLIWVESKPLHSRNCQGYMICTPNYDMEYTKYINIVCTPCSWFYVFICLIALSYPHDIVLASFMLRKRMLLKNKSVKNSYSYNNLLMDK